MTSIDTRSSQTRRTETALPPSAEAPSAPGLREVAADNANAVTDAYLGEGNRYLDDSADEEILGALGATNAADFQEVVGQMSEPELERLCDSLDVGQRARFLAMATGRGLVEETGGVQPQGALNPPREPRFIKNDPKYPAPLRELIHEENEARANAYAEKFDAYHDRWADAFRAAPDLAAKRRLGKPAHFAMPNAEPGFGGSDKLATDMAGDWVHRRRPAGHYDIQTYRTIHREVAKSQGRAPGGDFVTYVEANAHAEIEDPASGIGVKGGVRGEIARSGDGQVDSTLTPEGEVAANGASFTMSNDGEVAAVKGGFDIGIAELQIDLKTNKDGDLDGSASARLGVARVGITEKGEVDVAVVEKVDGKVGKGSVAVGVRFKPSIDADRLRNALKDTGSFFDNPKELTEGKAWNDLPAERRVALQAVNGWSEKEWSQQLSLQKANVIPFRR